MPSARRIAVKIILVLAICSFTGYFLVKYLTKGPDFFEQGLAQLRSNKDVIVTVGDFQTYSYNPKMFRELNHQAIFDVELEGNDTALYLTCIMRNTPNGWLLSKVKRDSTGRIKNSE